MDGRKERGSKFLSRGSVYEGREGGRERGMARWMGRQMD